MGVIDDLRKTTVKRADRDGPELNFRPFDEYLRTSTVIAATSTVIAVTSKGGVQTTDDPTRIEAETIVGAQAGFWLLTTTSNREDAVSAAQFILKISTQACAVVFEGSRAWQQFSHWACDAFNIWQSQPSDADQEVVEIFALTLCHVAAQPSEVLVQRNDPVNPQVHRESRRSLRQSDSDLELSVPANRRTRNPSQLGSSEAIPSPPFQRSRAVQEYIQANPKSVDVRESDSLGQTFVQALELVHIAYSTDEPDSGTYVVHIAFILTMITRGLAFYNYRWTRPLQLLSTGKSSDAADELLGLWAIAIERSNLQYTFWVQGSTFVEFLRLGDIRGNLQFEPDTLQGYIASLRRAAQLAPDTLPTIQRKTARGIEELIQSYIDPLMTSESGGNSSEFIQLSSEAVVCLHTLSKQIRGSEEPFILEGSRSEQLTGQLWIDAVVDILLEDWKRAPVRSTWLYRPEPPSVEDPTRSIGPCLIRILLWAHKRMSESPITIRNKRQILESSCRLWAPLEREVASSKTKGLEKSVGSFAPKDLDGIAEFTQDIIQSHKSSAFIARNADVGINRLYAHLGRRADWEYELFDMRKQHAALCSRAYYVENGLM
ncbi:hypothetical protein FRC00_005080 [Tulasnella sp. 408]|nr:hypothetical protein FRC00_005080 [Tulasnella sp. 408]